MQSSWVTLLEYVRARRGHEENDNSAIEHPVFVMHKKPKIFPVQAIQWVAHMVHACTFAGRMTHGFGDDDGASERVWRHDFSIRLLLHNEHWSRHGGCDLDGQ